MLSVPTRRWVRPWGHGGRIARDHREPSYDSGCRKGGSSVVRVAKHPGDAPFDDRPEVFGEVSDGKVFLENVAPDETMKSRLADKVQVLFPARNHLGDDQIMDLQAPSCRSSGVDIANRDEAFSPPLGQDGCRLVDTVGVVAEGLVEGRKLSDRPVDNVS